MCGPILFRKREARMKQIVIEIEDEAYEPFMGMLRICPAARVVGTNSFAETRDVIDRCFAEAIMELQADKKVYKRPSDLAYIMIGVNDGAINGVDYYLTPDDFTGYLLQVGINQLPKRSTIYNKVNDTVGKFPDWSFVHDVKPKEKIRRKNLLLRFSSAFGRAKRKKLDGFMDK